MQKRKQGNSRLPGYARGIKHLRTLAFVTHGRRVPSHRNACLASAALCAAQRPVQPRPAQSSEYCGVNLNSSATCSARDARDVVTVEHGALQRRASPACWSMQYCVVWSTVWAMRRMKPPRGTPTTATFLGATANCGSEQDAYIWVIEKVLKCAPKLSGDLIAEACRGKTGKEYFSTSSAKLISYQRLSNGWFAELTISNNQKVKIVEILTQMVGLTHDQWGWQATNRQTNLPPDGNAMLKELEGSALPKEVPNR